MEQEFKISNREFYKIYFEGTSPLTSVQMWLVSSSTYVQDIKYFISL